MPYPPEFRRRALDLVASGRTVRDVAASLGIAESCLYGWKTRDLIDRGLKPGITTSESAEMAAAQRGIRELEDEVKILRKAAAAVEKVVPPKERFQLVAELADDGIDVKRACRELGVSRAGYYEWRTRAPSAQAIRRIWLSDRIAVIHEASQGTYGSRRVQAELVHAQGVTIGHDTVALLMRRAGPSALPLRRRAKTVPASVTITDLVRREFARNGPNQLRVTDITEHPTREGKLYCCVVIDTFSRRVVGWAIDSRARTDLATNALGMATNALGMAIEARSHGSGQIPGGVIPGGVIPGGVIHGDHGTQGGFNWRSQHLDLEVDVWSAVSVRSRHALGRIEGRPPHRGRRRWLGVRIGFGSGRRSLVAPGRRTHAARPACRGRSGSGGFVTLAA